MLISSCVGLLAAWIILELVSSLFIRCFPGSSADFLVLLADFFICYIIIGLFVCYLVCWFFSCVGVLLVVSLDHNQICWFIGWFANWFVGMLASLLVY